MFRAALVVALAALSFSCATTSGNGGSSAASDDLRIAVEKSPFRLINKIFPEMIPELFSTLREDFGYSDEQLARFNGVAQERCSPEKLRATSQAYLESKMSSGDIALAAGFLRSAEGDRALTEMLQSNERPPEELKARILELQRSPPPEGRKQAVARFSKAFELSRMMKLTVGITEAALRIAVAPASPPLTDEALAEMIKEGTAEIVALGEMPPDFAELVMQAGLVNVSDAELAQALVYLDSEAGRLYLKTIEEATLQSIRTCTADVEQQLKPQGI